MEYLCPECGMIWYAECMSCHALNITNNIITGVRCLSCGSYELNNSCPSCSSVVKKPTDFEKCYLSTACVRARGEKESESKELKILRFWRDKILAENTDTELAQKATEIFENSHKIIDAICKKTKAHDILDRLYYELVEKTIKPLNKGMIREAVKNYIISYDTAKRRYLKEKAPTSIEELKSVNLRNCKIIDGELIFQTQLKEICKRTFKNYSVLIQKAHIPQGVQIIKESAFRDCKRLDDLSLPESLKRVEYHAFVNCRALKKVIFPKNVEFLGCCLFTGCNNLESVDFGAYSGSFETSPIGGNVFCDFSDSCRILSEIKVDKDNALYTVCDGVLFSKDFKRLIVCPPGLSQESYIIPDTVEIIEPSAFYRCMNLRSITFGKNVKSIGCHAFEFCVGLEKVEINDGLQAIGTQAFMDCRSLTQINLPESVTDIGDLAFSRCELLENISIPKLLKQINQSVFRECTALKNVYVPDAVTQLNNLTFSECRSIRELELPVAIDSISWDTFLNCNKDLTIKIRGTNESYFAEDYVAKIKYVE